MKNLTFSDGADISVTYKVDLIGNAQTLTVMEVKGLDTVPEQKLFHFQKLPSNLPAFKQFAIDHNLNLDVDDNREITRVNTSTTTTTTTTAAPTTTTTTTVGP